MRLKYPFQISARLLPALRIGERSWLSWSWADYRFYLDTPDFEYEITDFRPGAGSGVQDIFAAILSFMGAAAESRHYREFVRRSDEIDPDSNEDLFPPHIVDWIMDNRSDIDCLGIDLEECPELIEEEFV